MLMRFAAALTSFINPPGGSTGMSSVLGLE